MKRILLPFLSNKIIEENKFGGKRKTEKEKKKVGEGGGGGGVVGGFNFNF